jgi:16S rRNA (adenine1518-N6/adenine1519-N6)-dimethyltransferase
MYHRAKKSLGQNFLKSAKALSDIIIAGEINKNDIILEIGPGKGALTEKLLEHAGKVIAIEKDNTLVIHLKEQFKKEIEEGRFELIEGDVLDFDPKTLKKPYKIIANIPYNITGAILRQFLSDIHKPEQMVLLVQKEVAERIVARDGNESILSLSVKAYGIPKIISKVPARYFNPAPKVDSAIIAITNITRENFKNTEEEQLFFTIVKAGFAHKRKMLLSNLKESLPHVEWNTLFEKNIIPKTIRAEKVPLTTWVKYAKDTI